MGMTPVRIDDRHEVRVKDNVSGPDGWHLWMALYVDGLFKAGEAGPVVPNLEDQTLEDAARLWFAVRKDAA